MKACSESILLMAAFSDMLQLTRVIDLVIIQSFLSWLPIMFSVKTALFENSIGGDQEANHHQLYKIRVVTRKWSGQNII